jgi:hypothetical protein
MMQNNARVDQKISDHELIALFCQTQEEIEAHGQSNELNLLLRDFGKELLKQRLFARVVFVRLMELKPGSVVDRHTREVAKPGTWQKFQM